MGAWGPGAFDNDTAADFSGMVENCADEQARMAVLETKLAYLIKHWDRLYNLPEQGFEYPYEIEQAIAAAAYVADAKNGRYEFTDTPYAQMRVSESKWLPIPLDQPSQHLVTLALVAMSCVKTALEIKGFAREWIEPIEAILAALDN